LGQSIPLSGPAALRHEWQGLRFPRPHGAAETVGERDPHRSLERSIAGLPDQTALLDSSWRVLAVSAAWAREGRTGDIDAIVPGDNLRRLAALWAAQGRHKADVLLEAIERLSAGRGSAFHAVFETSDRIEDPRYAVSIACLKFEDRRYFTVTRCEVSQLSQMAERCRELEEEVREAREQERKRIGRELHDSTSQLLVGLKLCLMRMKESDDPAKAASIVGEMDEILLDIDQEIRSISFLLHPPRLQGRGLPEAIRYMADGFARRSGLDIAVDLEGALPPRIPELEATLYRLTQEALANAYRHADATRVTVRLVARNATVVHLLIEDNGSGPAEGEPLAAGPGVGIEGMSARVAELGGRFSFRRVGRGCRLLASIPASPGGSRLAVA
jgi:signal transduction histidine kinase